MSDNKSSGDKAPKIHNHQSGVESQCSSLMGKEYEVHLIGRDHSEIPRKKQSILESSNLLLRTLSLDSGLEALHIRETYALTRQISQSILAETEVKVEIPPPSSFKKALSFLREAFRLELLHWLRKKTSETPPSAMKITSSTTAKPETSEPQNYQQTSSQVVHFLHDQYLMNQTLSRLSCSKYCFQQNMTNK